MRLATAVVLGSLAASSVARAAPAPPCYPATIQPQLDGTPANLPGIAYSATQATEADIHLFDVSGANPVEVPLTVGPVVDGVLKVVPSSLAAGDKYELRYAPFCDYGGFPTGPLKFQVAPTAPLPTSIGTLDGAPKITEHSYSVDIAATYTLSQDMLPWARQYVFTAIVDDQRAYESAGTVANGKLTVAGTYLCAKPAPAATHVVTIRGHLPFVADLTTSSTEVTFTCPDPPPNTVPPSAAPNANPQTSPSSKSGFGCSATAGDARSLAGGSALVALAALVLMRRRATSASAAKRRT